jgi:hypothetical protein
LNAGGYSLQTGPDGRMFFSCYGTNTISFINKEGVESFKIGKDKTGAGT